MTFSWNQTPANTEFERHMFTPCLLCGKLKEDKK